MYTVKIENQDRRNDPTASASERAVTRLFSYTDFENDSAQFLYDEATLLMDVYGKTPEDIIGLELNDNSEEIEINSIEALKDKDLNSFYFGKTYINIDFDDLKIELYGTSIFCGRDWSVTLCNGDVHEHSFTTKRDG